MPFKCLYPPATAVNVYDGVLVAFGFSDETGTVTGAYLDRDMTQIQGGTVEYSAREWVVVFTAVADATINKLRVMWQPIGEPAPAPMTFPISLSLLPAPKIQPEEGSKDRGGLIGTTDIKYPPSNGVPIPKQNFVCWGTYTSPEPTLDNHTLLRMGAMQPRGKFKAQGNVWLIHFGALTGPVGSTHYVSVTITGANIQSRSGLPLQENLGRLPE